jgi:hypothetical protein
MAGIALVVVVARDHRAEDHAGDRFHIEEPERLRERDHPISLPELDQALGVQPRTREGPRGPFLRDGSAAGNRRQQRDAEFQLGQGERGGRRRGLFVLSRYCHAQILPLNATP